MTRESDKIAREAYPILFISLLGSAALYFFHPLAGACGVLWVVYCLYFFRNPGRVASCDANCLIAPADGVVVYAGLCHEKYFLDKPMQRVTIFMSPFNVHVNRAPATGEVVGIKYHQGCFRAAFRESASHENERTVMRLKTSQGDDIVLVQVAGWFARRIRNYLKTGDRIEMGKIFGLIKFGSRVDVYLPVEYKLAVTGREKVKAGVTVIANAGR